jgi:hypothetical protein
MTGKFFKNRCKFFPSLTLGYIILLFTICFASNSFAKTYYFSTSHGDDLRTPEEATKPATPWKSLNRLNLYFVQLNPGDSVLFNRGEIFTGTIEVRRSGNPLSPITFGAYGDGVKPIVSGLSILRSWNSAGNGIYQAACSTCPPENNLLILNDLPQARGRFPNDGYLKYEGHQDNNAIYDNELSAEPNWTGADVVIRKNRWILDKIKITSHLGKKISYSAGTNDLPIDNFGYFIQNDIKTLDKTGEWFFDPVGKIMHVFLGANDPGLFSIKTSTVNTLVRITGYNHIVFENLEFQGANVSAFEIVNSQFISIRNCSIDLSTDAINGTWSPNFTIENTSISYSLNSGINVDKGCTNALIKNNSIKNTGLMPGMGKSGSGTYQAIMSFGENAVIDNNAIDSTGYNAIYFGGTSSQAKNNYINNFCLTKDDGGGIYVGDWFISSGKKITGNIILNGGY